jgi:Xaa-Pro aminopeptidase
MRLASSAHLHVRLEKLRGLLGAADVDALLVTHVANIFYLTNFSGTAANVVVTADSVHFITDFRYVAATEALLSSGAGPPNVVLVPVDRSYDETVAGVVRRLGPTRLGFEAAHLAVKRYRWLERTLGDDHERAPSGIPETTGGRRAGPVLVETERLIERLRLVKDSHELQILREAAGRLSAVAPQALREVRVGRPEREVAAAIDWRMRLAGFDKPAFDTIVASGPNSALPHARPGDRRIERGDLVLIDFGGVHGGYCVDLTRTVAVGHPDRQAQRLYDAVRAAQQAALDAVAAGVPAHVVDSAARETLARFDLADAFGHGTGHGLGIEVHEEPRLTRRDASAEEGDQVCLEPGMVFTIEPGAYVPGIGGVRIEDDVAVTEQGGEVLTQVPRELLIIE